MSGGVRTYEVLRTGGPSGGGEACVAGDME